MQTINKILVPVDFSGCSFNALSYALNFAREMQSSINVLRTFEYENKYVEARKNNAALLELKKERQDRLDKEVNKLTGAYEEAPVVHTYCKMGSLTKVINNFVKNDRADLIIMGTYSKNPLKRLLLGSSAISVMEKIDKPVLLVPPSAHYTGLKHIAFGTNYHSGSIHTLKQLTEMFGSIHSEISILHFITDHKPAHGGDEFRKAVQNEVKYKKLDFKEIPAKDLQSGSGDYILTNRTDLLAMSNKRRSGLTSFFNTPAENAAIYTRVPLLVIPRERLSLDISLEPEEIL